MMLCSKVGVVCKGWLIDHLLIFRLATTDEHYIGGFRPDGRSTRSPQRSAGETILFQKHAVYARSPQSENDRKSMALFALFWPCCNGEYDCG